MIVVTPVFEDAAVSTRLLEDLACQFEKPPYMVVVDDGSVREPIDPSSLERAGLPGVVLRLRRNVGHQRAIAVGLGYVAEHCNDDEVVVMDSDGEDRPESVQTLVSKLHKDDVDVVVAQRRKRSETWSFRVFYVVYKWLFVLLTGRSISFGNFMALRLRAVKRLTAMQELGTHVAGTLLASKLRIEFCSLDRGQRYSGKSKMNFVSLALHGFKALMIFAEDVLVRVGSACALIAVGSVVGAMGATLLKVVGFSTPGWFSVALGLLVVIFLQTGVLTLMTLMLTGIVRGGTVVPIVAYREFIEDIRATQQ